MEQVKVGTGWRQPGGPVWLVIEAGPDEVVLARWADNGEQLLSRQEGRVSPTELACAWRPVPKSEVEELVEQLMGTSVADEMYGLQQTAKEAGVRDQDSEVDREREAERERRLRERESVAVPVAKKSVWLSAQELAGMEAHSPGADEPEVRANAPMEERAGIVPPRTVGFPHDYPGAPGHDPENPGECFTSNCRYGCGCYAGPNRSGGPEGVDPFGECPKHPELVALQDSPLYQAQIAAGKAEVDAMFLLAEELVRRERQQQLAADLEEMAERLMYEARELRRLADVSDDEESVG